MLLRRPLTSLAALAPLFTACAVQLGSNGLTLNGNDPFAKKPEDPPASPKAQGTSASYSPERQPPPAPAPSPLPDPPAEKPVPSTVAEQPDAAPLKGPKVRPAWDGVYGGPPDLQCGSENGILFNPKGPDVQVVEASTTYYQSGPRCPSTCGFPAAVVVKDGVAQIPVLWVDYQPADDSRYTARVTLRRTVVPVPLFEQTAAQNTDKRHVHFGYRSTFGKNGYAAGNADVHTPPRRMSTHGAAKIDDTSHQRLVVSGFSLADPKAGTGRVLAFDLAVDARGEWLNEETSGGCQLELKRSDFQPGEGTDDGGAEDDAPSRSGSRGAHSSGSDRKCIKACKAEAGECRKDCHGQSAKCASDCNRAERDCEDGC